MMMKKNKAKNIGESKKIEFSIIIIINKKNTYKIKVGNFFTLLFFLLAYGFQFDRIKTHQ